MSDSSAIMTDAQTDDGFDTSDDDAAAAFLTNLTAAEETRKPSKGTDEATETEEEAPSEETEETTEEGEEETATDEKKDAKTAVELADDATVKVKVNGEDVEVSIGDLKRLAGQERALNQKSMEVAEARKAYETSAAKAETTLKAMLEKAEARFKPYAELDYLKLSRSMDEASWDVLRSEALKAQEDVKFLKDGLADHTKTAQETSQRELAQAAKAAVSVLSGPVTSGGIEGWSQSLYNDLMAYAVSQGVPQATAYSIVDPAAIRVMHKAMMFDKGKTAATAQIAKVKAAPTKVARPSSNGSSSGQSSKSSEAVSRLSRTGSDDDGVAAFLASMRG